MIKTKLYAIKTQRGYGLFQKLNKRKLLDPFNYIIYKQQIGSLDKKNINQALDSGYILANLDAYMANVEILLEGYNGKEVSLINSNIVMGTSGSKKYLYGNCFVTYLGECENSFNGDYPKYTKISLYDVHMGVIYWNIEDEILHKPILGQNGKRFDTLPKEYLNYPLRGCLRPRELVEFFNDGDISYAYFDDKWARWRLEEHYKEYPKTRPLNESIDDIKKQIPTEVWKKSFPDGEKKKEYCENCDKVAKILQEFINFIDNGGKISAAEVKRLNAKLNKLNEETEFFDTMEAEDLYLWFVKYFKAMNYPKAVEILEEMREW